jgi:hypothetical protein
MLSQLDEITTTRLPSIVRNQGLRGGVGDAE